MKTFLLGWCGVSVAVGAVWAFVWSNAPGTRKAAKKPPDP